MDNCNRECINQPKVDKNQDCCGCSDTVEGAKLKTNRGFVESGYYSAFGSTVNTISLIKEECENLQAQQPENLENRKQEESYYKKRNLSEETDHSARVTDPKDESGNVMYIRPNVEVVAQDKPSSFNGSSVNMSQEMQTFPDRQTVLGNGDQHNSETTVTGPGKWYLHRDASVPGTVTEEKKESLQEQALNDHTHRNLGRSISCFSTATRSNSEENCGEDFRHIKRDQYRKTKSTSDLGTSQDSTVPDDTASNRRRSYKESGVGSYSSCRDSIQEEALDEEAVDNSSSVEIDVDLPMIDQREDFLQNLYNQCIEDYDKFCFEKYEKIRVGESSDNSKQCSFELALELGGLPTDSEAVKKRYDKCVTENKFDFGKLNHVSQYWDENVLQPIVEEKSMEPSIHDQLCLDELEKKISLNPHDVLCVKILNDLESRQEVSASVPVSAPVLECHEYKTNEELDRQLQCYLKLAVCDDVRKRLQNGDYTLESLQEQIVMALETVGRQTSVHTDSDTSSYILQDDDWESTDSGYAAMLACVTQCDLEDCDNEECRKGNCLYKMIQQQEKFCGVSYSVLRSLLSHSRTCDVERCGVPWCTFFSQRLEDSEDTAEIISKFQREYFSACSVNITPDDNSEFISLQEDQGYESMPDDYSGLTRIHPLKDVFFKSGRNTESSLRHYIIKKSPCCEENVDVLKSLKNENVSRLVKMLCAVKTQPFLLTTAHYEEYSNLREHMKSFHADGMPIDKLRRCKRSLEEAMNFLHKKGILYLNWLAEHVLYGGDDRLLLCNFTTAVCQQAIEGNDDLASDLTGRLPPFVLPPELSEDRVKFPESDYWGLGCLLYEMAQGNHVFWHLRHLMHEQQRNAISQQPVPDLSNITDNGLKSFLGSCFMTEPDKRLVSSLS